MVLSNYLVYVVSPQVIFEEIERLGGPERITEIIHAIPYINCRINRVNSMATELITGLPCWTRLPMFFLIALIRGEEGLTQLHERRDKWCIKRGVKPILTRRQVIMGHVLFWEDEVFQIFTDILDRPILFHFYDLWGRCNGVSVMKYPNVTLELKTKRPLSTS